MTRLFPAPAALVPNLSAPRSSRSTRPGDLTLRLLLADPTLPRQLRSALTTIARQDRDHVLQDALVTALRARCEPPTDRAECLRWLAGVVRHTVADVHRARKRDAAYQACSLSCAYDDAAVDRARDALEEVEEQARRHPEDAQALGWIVQAERDGRRVVEVAAEQGVPAEQAWTQVQTLRRRLRRARDRP